MSIRHPLIGGVALWAAFCIPSLAEVSQQTLDAISIPGKVDTSIGTLEFFDGVPTDATVAKVYENLDRMRGMEVFLDNVGAVSMYSVRKEGPR